MKCITYIKNIASIYSFCYLDKENQKMFFLTFSATNGACYPACFMPASAFIPLVMTSYNHSSWQPQSNTVSVLIVSA